MADLYCQYRFFSVTDTGYHVHMLRGYGDKLESFLKMVAEARTFFPGLKDGDITLGVVNKSSRCNGFSIIAFFTDTQPPAESFVDHTGQRQEYCY